MSKLTKFILTFCGITFLLGGILFGVGQFFGEKSQQNPWFGENVFGDVDVTVDGMKIYLGENAENVECMEKNEILPDFENIHMQAECANVQIVTGKEFQISCTYPENEMPDYKVVNNTLEVIQDKQEDYVNTGNVTRSIIISIPEQAVLKDVTLENVVGNISITAINAYSCMTTLTTGNVEISNSEMESCHVTISTGNIDISQLVSEDCGVSTSTGEVDITASDVKKYVIANGVGDTFLDLSKVTYDYSMDVETNVGKVYLDGEEVGKKYEKDRNEECCIKIRKNVGDINIKTK